jgi:hypothetical protein
VKLLGDWLVWESKGCTYTLDTDLISSTIYYAPTDWRGPRMSLYCRDELEAVAELKDADAEWFQAWWMKRLEQRLREEEETAVRCADILAHRTTPPQDT